MESENVNFDVCLCVALEIQREEKMFKQQK